MLPYPIAQTCQIVVICAASQIFARNGCISFSVAVGLFTASPTSFLLVFSSVLEGCPGLLNVTVGPYFLHLTMTVFTVFRGTLKALGILLDPLTDTFEQ